MSHVRFNAFTCSLLFTVTLFKKDFIDEKTKAREVGLLKPKAPLVKGRPDIINQGI